MSQSSAQHGDGWETVVCAETPTCPVRSPWFTDTAGAHWRFRTADMDDIDQLTALYDAFGAADRAQGIPPAVDHKRRSWVEMLLTDGHNIVAEGADQIVGHVVYTPAAADRPELAVFVHPEYHNRGIGTELCKQLVAAAAATDKTALELHVERRNAAAVAVYHRLGFEAVTEGHELEMVLPLENPVVNTLSRETTDRTARS